MELHEAVVCLANWRAETKRLETAQRAMVKAVMESTEYKRLGEEYVHAHQMEGETEWTVRELAVDFWRLTGNEQPHDAVVIKVDTEYDGVGTKDVPLAHIATDLSAYL